MSMTQPDVSARSVSVADRPAQRGYVTILFADLSNSTEISASLEAEEFAELLGSIRAVFQSVLPRHGGTIVRIDGDGVAAVFGFPQAHEDDGRRAVEAALDLRAGVRDLSRTFRPGLVTRLHIGINSGLVLLNPGDLVRGRFEMLGDATNLAAHLADCADADDIVISEATLGRDRHLFETSRPVSITVRGRADPVSVLHVLDRAEAPTRFDAWLRRGRTPLAGRDTELARLGTLLAEVPHNGTLVAVVGAPGLGKTRLVTEFLSHAGDGGHDVQHVDCGSYLEQVTDPFERIARALDGRAGRPVASHLSPSERASIIARHAAERPLVCYIDDWHLAGEAAHQTLQTLRRLARSGLLVILGARAIDEADPSLRAAEIIRLQPLTLEQATPAISALLSRSDPFLLRRVHQYAGGNPLFIEELCHAIDESADESGWPNHTWLDTLVQARFRRIPDAQAAIVRIAAVIGTIIPVALLELMAGGRIPDDHLRALAEADFIYPGETPAVLRFKHGLMRDIIYEAVGLHERRALHRRVAEELSSGRVLEGIPPDALAYHYRAAGDYVSGARYAEDAADAAKADSALDHAQDRYRDALYCLKRLEPTADRLEAWNRIVQKLGLAAIFDPSAAHLPVFREAAERAAARGDDAGVSWAEHRLAYVNLARGDRTAAIRHAVTALDFAAAAGDVARASRVRETLGQALASAARYDEALPLLNEAIGERRRAEGRRSCAGLAYALASKGFALADLGRFEEAECCFDEARERIDGLRHEVEASVLSMRGAALLWQGRHAEAFHFAEDAAAVAERVRARSTYAMCRALSGYSRWLLTGDGDALATLVDATNWLRGGADERQYASLCYGWLAEISASLGRHGDVRRYAALALRRARLHDHLGEAAACRALARSVQQAGGKRPAAHYLMLAGRAANRRNSAHEHAANLRCAADLCAAAGNEGEADALLHRAQAAFGALAMRWPGGQVAAASRGPPSAG